jgi:hypothetical protein
MFVTTQTLLTGTDQFPETWVFEQFTTTKFSPADSCIRITLGCAVGLVALKQIAVVLVVW